MRCLHSSISLITKGRNYRAPAFKYRNEAAMVPKWKTQTWGWYAAGAPHCYCLYTETKASGGSPTREQTGNFKETIKMNAS